MADDRGQLTDRVNQGLEERRKLVPELRSLSILRSYRGMHDARALCEASVSGASGRIVGRKRQPQETMPNLPSPVR